MDNIESHKAERKVTLKVKPELYKIRIGKKKTGLPNLNYPPINPEKTLKNANFPILSVLYDESHIEDVSGKQEKNKKPKIHKGDYKTKGNQKLIINKSDKKDEDYNFGSSLNSESTEMEREYPRKCCDRCSIF